MSISRVRTARWVRKVRRAARYLVAAGAALFAAVPAAGCARTGAASPEPPPARPGAAFSAPLLDPSEEITPEELATIPEPVPASSGGTPRSTRSPLPAAQTAQQVDLAPLEPRAQAPANLWRVQVFVTQDRSLADRMAKEAAQRLNVKAHVAYEASHYKVRLGDYRSEDEAQPLRERAVRAGFPGAFRIRCTPGATNYID